MNPGSMLFFMIFMVQASELAQDYQRKNRKWIYDALVKP